jgi:SAM-dependent methyltransferase
LAYQSARALAPGADVLVPAWNPPTVPAERELDPRATPARVVCDLFWDELPGDVLRHALGGRVDVLDLGCGRGVALAQLDRALSFDSYLGVDPRPRPEWEMLTDPPRILFDVASGESLARRHVDGRTLIVSQSVLEHVRYDLDVLRRFAAEVAHGALLVQIHLIPPPALWRLWGVHGFRSYTGRALDRIREAVAPSCAVDVLALGGPALNRVHFEDVYDARASLARRAHADRRSADPDAYVRRVCEALATDAERGSHVPLATASFAAVVIRPTGMALPLTPRL